MIDYNLRYLPMLQGNLTGFFTQITTSVFPPAQNSLTGNAHVKIGPVDLVISDYEQLRVTLKESPEITVQTLKLFDVLVLILSQQNKYRCDSTRINRTVSIALDDYVQMCGKPLTKATKDVMRKSLHRDMTLLCHISLGGSELYGAQTKSFSLTRLLEQAHIEKGRIIATFSDQMANYLVHADVTQYPVALLATDNRAPAAYFVGKKLAYHFGLHQNRTKGSYNCLSVGALLKVIPSILSIERVEQTDPGHWARRIRTPLEKALDALKNSGVLSTWDYCLAKKKEILDPSRYFQDYQTYSGLYIRFELQDYPVTDAAGRKKKHTALPEKPAV